MSTKHPVHLFLTVRIRDKTNSRSSSVNSWISRCSQMFRDYNRRAEIERGKNVKRFFRVFFCLETLGPLIFRTTSKPRNSEQFSRHFHPFQFPRFNRSQATSFPLSSLRVESEARYCEIIVFRASRIAVLGFVSQRILVRARFRMYAHENPNDVDA